MQGTAATVMAAVFSAVRAAGTRIRDQRVVIYGAGTAGLGIADMMREQMIREGLHHDEATRRFYPMGSQGLLVDDDPYLLDFQQPYARPRAEVGRLGAGDRGIGLAEVVSRVKPTMLIGTSTHTGAFTEAIVRTWPRTPPGRSSCRCPTRRRNAKRCPADLVEWTDGRVLTATGSPFGPVTYQDRTFQIAQANNALVFPGLGLGVAVAKARRISDGMIAAAADAVARMSDATSPGAALLPPDGRPPHRLGGGRRRRRHRGGRGRSGPGRAPRPDPTGSRRHVAARLPAYRTAPRLTLRTGGRHGSA